MTVSSDEPVDGTGDGNTSPDWEVVDAHHVRLRAERAGGGDGRTYTISITCTNDTNGLSSTETVTVLVPHDHSEFFVRQHYLDFLNRPADPSGLDFWSRNIRDCGDNQSCIDGKQIDTSAAFFLSIEFQEKGYLVERIYKTAFGDAQGRSTLNGEHAVAVPIVPLGSFMTDTSTIGSGVVVGEGDWQTLLNQNKDVFCGNFVNREEFMAKYPLMMLPATYVQQLNQNAGNPLSATELAALIDEHTAGTKNRAQVLRTIAEHQNL